MAFVGLLIAFLGFVTAVASLGVTDSNIIRLGMVLVGIVISVVGIMGVLNPAYQKDAIWRK